MSRIRSGRRRYYDIFSNFYDAFIRMHSRQNEDDTRGFLVDSAHLQNKPFPRILDICCGTGSVILTFKESYPAAMAVGYDFSHGMLRKAQEKDEAHRIAFTEGDAAMLPFVDDSFDVVTCSHALYELKGETRKEALREMKRVVRPDGYVLLMEHEIPSHPFVKLLFYIRMFSMGSNDAREFMQGETSILGKIFTRVTTSHSRTGKSKLLSCQK